MLRQRGRVGLMAAALVGLMVGGAQAQVTIERSASILVFPKVISDGTRDTIIQITNTSNSMVHAHCFYVNGALTFTGPGSPPPGPLNPPLWTEVDFDIWLTKQQPTHWVVSKGRLENPADAPCTNGSTNPPTPPNFACDEAGLDPGRVPPVVEFFTGELKCIEVDQSGMPVSGNHLKGEATVVTLDNCNLLTGRCVITGETCVTQDDCEDDLDVGKYNALGILGNENNNGDNVLCLGGEPSETCPNGAEYDACPEFWYANHFAEFAPDPVDLEHDEVEENDSLVRTAWTVVPCTQNFETQDPTTVTIFIRTFNEYEQVFSSFLTVTCWNELFLDDINPVTFDYTTLGTTFAVSELRSTQATASSFLMVGEEFHSVDTDVEPDGQDTFTSVAFVNYVVKGLRTGPDLITIPPEQISGGAAGAQ